jgi:hypothetical protein
MISTTETKFPTLTELCTSEILAGSLENTFIPAQKQFFEGLLDQLWFDLKSDALPPSLRG